TVSPGREKSPCNPCISTWKAANNGMQPGLRNPKSEIHHRQGRWCLMRIKEILDFEEELAGAMN
ncbi:MAG TPA: hypothetical protein VKS19_10390, partial [Verrucomicrobiae bacterium]|nr:hypothetical protein [Verrucomicrobiae bacterium]